MLRIDQRPRLLHMLSQRLAQRSMKKVRGGMVAHGALAHSSVHDWSKHFANFNLLVRSHLMEPYTLYRHYTAEDVSYNGCAIGIIEPTDITYLSSRIGVEGRVIENDL